jgi:glycerate kinase
MGVARAAKEHGIPVICLSGGIGPGYEAVYDVGIDALFSIVPGPISLEEAIERGPALMADATERTLRLACLTQPRNEEQP